MKVSGNATSAAPAAAASRMSEIALFVVAALSRNTGAAWTAAALKRGSMDLSFCYGQAKLLRIAMGIGNPATRLAAGDNPPHRKRGWHSSCCLEAHAGLQLARLGRSQGIPSRGPRRKPRQRGQTAEGGSIHHQ